MKNGEVRPGHVIIFAGAFIAFLVGSGFATGQEIMQYFVSYGFMGIAGAVVVFVLFLYVGVSFITVGYEQQFPEVRRPAMRGMVRAHQPFATPEHRPIDHSQQ